MLHFCLEPLRLQLERELEAHVAEEQKSLDEQEQAKLEEEEEERKQKESGPAAVFRPCWCLVPKGVCFLRKECDRLYFNVFHPSNRDFRTAIVA